jgi:Protein phosphatase 2C
LLMLAQVTMLRYWKSEHDEESCEDAIGENTAQGLFVVADGAGTTLFSDAWAGFIVQHFLRVPLMSNDPFEVEWWIRQAQEQFKNEFAGVANMPWNAQQKAQSQGSYTTLATLRVTVGDATHAQADLLIFGDSCVFVSRPESESILSFPLTQVDEFDQAPVCIPSKPGVFNRYFHQCHVTSLDLAPCDAVVIATDAVSKWIISAGDGHYRDQRMAFQEVTQQTSASWANFIQECRAKEEMIDDDTTALIIALHPDTCSEGFPPGTTTEHSQAVRENRKQEFIQALNTNNKEQVAISFGDGRDLLAEGIEVPPYDILLARKVADAQREVLAMLRQEVNNPNVVAIMTPVWQKHAHLLYQEPCAENIRKTLTRLGISIEPTIPVISSDNDETTEIALPPFLDDSDMLYTRVFDVTEIRQSIRPSGKGEESKHA